jgi:hypothetical protein
MTRVRSAIPAVAASVLAAFMLGLFLANSLVGADVAPPGKAEAPQKPKPGQSGLLLRPLVDLSSMTPEKFVENISTVGPEKIHKPWTSPITALPPHARRDVKGLTEMEVRDYMLQVRRMFDQGNSIPVSNVGLVSTEDGPVRRPNFNHVAVFSNDVAHVYLLVQRELGDKDWAYFSIVQDRTTDPPSDYYGRMDSENKVSYRGARCYRCHSSGPLAIHAARADLVSDARLAAAISKHIAAQPQSRFVFWKGDLPPDYGKPLALGACTKCHDTDGDRAPLFKVHEHPIRVLVDYGYMPPNRRLTAEELAELKAWLDPLADWKTVNDEPDDAIVADCKGYIEKLPKTEQADLATLKYHVNGKGGNAVTVNVLTGDMRWTHLLTYDEKHKRTDVLKYVPGK